MISVQRQWEFIAEHAMKLGVGEEALRKWRARGVAYKYRLPITEAARKAGVKLDPNIFEADTLAQLVVGAEHAGSKPSSRRSA